MELEVILQLNSSLKVGFEGFESDLLIARVDQSSVQFLKITNVSQSLRGMMPSSEESQGNFDLEPLPGDDGHLPSLLVLKMEIQPCVEHKSLLLATRLIELIILLLSHFDQTFIVLLNA